MRSPFAFASLVAIALVPPSGFAQATPPATPANPPAAPHAQFKTPDEAIKEFGRVLEAAGARTDQEEAAVRADADARNDAVQKELDDLQNSVDPDAAKYKHDAPGVEADCPRGQQVPVEQAKVCKARMAALDALFAKLKTRHDDLEAKKDQIAADEATAIAKLEQKKVTVESIQAEIETCADNPDTASKKKCLDRFFDNAALAKTARDLDPTVVRPEYVGGKQPAH
jgi:cell division protein FtsB